MERERENPQWESVERERENPQWESVERERENPQWESVERERETNVLAIFNDQNSSLCISYERCVA